MRLIRSFILIAITTIISFDSFAETVTGCRIGEDDFLYTSYKGVKSYAVSQWYSPTFPTYSSPKKDFLQEWYNSYASCPYFVGNPSYGAQCAVQGITTVQNGQMVNLGNTITYTISYECPIDTNVVVLMVAIGGSSIYFIRRKAFYS